MNKIKEAIVEILEGDYCPFVDNYIIIKDINKDNVWDYLSEKLISMGFKNPLIETYVYIVQYGDDVVIKR